MEKQVEQLLKKLNIKEPYEKQDNYYVVRYDSYEDFIRLYNKLEKSLVVFKNSLLSFVTEEEGHIQYETDDGLILELVAIFDEDDYTLNISKEEDN